MADRTVSIQVIDSHTEGEPTRVVVAGGPDLGGGSLAAQRDQFRSRFDWFRSAVVNEPRGSDALVGALLMPPQRPECDFGVIYFNNVGYLGMCVHGTIGLAVTLAHLGRIQPGVHRLDTPVGIVSFELLADGQVAVRNVPSYRYQAGQSVRLPDGRVVRGDVAWGGNWFFLVDGYGESLEMDRIESLLDLTWQIRQALAAEGITGEGGAEIDHIELFGPSSTPGADSRNFVLCPGRQYDRSPCGTGTSAKLACLHADGKLEVGQVWRQESILGTAFDASLELQGTSLIPVIRGAAYITADSRLLLDPNDPFRHGVRNDECRTGNAE